MLFFKPALCVQSVRGARLTPHFDRFRTSLGDGVNDAKMLMQQLKGSDAVCLSLGEPPRAAHRSHLRIRRGHPPPFAQASSIWAATASCHPCPVRPTACPCPQNRLNIEPSRGRILDPSETPQWWELSTVLGNHVLLGTRKITLLTARESPFSKPKSSVKIVGGIWIHQQALSVHQVGEEDSSRESAKTLAFCSHFVCLLGNTHEHFEIGRPCKNKEYSSEW